MPCFGVAFHPASPLRRERGEARSRVEIRRRTDLSGYTSGSKQTGILIHVEGSAPDGIRLKHASSEVMNETKGRDDEGCRAWELGATVGGGVVPGMEIGQR